ncbi:hypothetical protein FOZ62_014355, partial [Perkinsus olseni]
NYELQRLRQILLRDPNFNGSLDNATLFEDHSRAVREQQQDLRDQMRSQMPPAYRDSVGRDGDEAAGGNSTQPVNSPAADLTTLIQPEGELQGHSSFETIMSYIGLGSG